MWNVPPKRRIGQLGVKRAPILNKPSNLTAEENKGYWICEPVLDRPNLLKNASSFLCFWAKHESYNIYLKK